MPEKIIPDEQKTPAEERAFDEGARARHQGVPISENPHSLGDDEQSVLLVCAWRDGWQAAGRGKPRRRAGRGKGKG
jgi:hypothetical protein